MIIDLKSFDDISREFSFSLRPDEIDLGAENIRLASDVSVQGDVTKHIAQTDVKGRVSSAVEIDCVRCLEPVELKLEFDFNVGYVLPEHFAVDKEKEVASDDLDIDVLSEDRIDLKEVIREQILLNLPDGVFCKEDCKGLCQQCGANLNLIDCNCKETEIDPRWAALKKLK